MKCPNCSKEVRLETRVFGDAQRVFQVCKSCEFDAAKNHLKIEELWAWVSVDAKDQNEGIITVGSPMGPLPMVGADKDRMLSMRQIAEQAAKNAGIEVKLLRFSTREDIETLRP
jgi:hypothetical protein